MVSRRLTFVCIEIDLEEHGIGQRRELIRQGADVNENINSLIVRILINHMNMPVGLLSLSLLLLLGELIPQLDYQQGAINYHFPKSYQSAKQPRTHAKYIIGNIV